MKNSESIQRPATALSQEDSFNAGLTAIPKDLATDVDGLETPIEFGEMNEDDARESGYIDKNGHAVSLAKEDVPGSPTGAYTDIGAGRSSVVHK